MKHILEIPWEKQEYFKEKYGLKVIRGGYGLYAGMLLPRELRAYRSEDFTLARWQEDEANAHVSTPEKSLRRFMLHPHQAEVVTAVLEAHTRGEKGFILADKRGLGKKLSALASVTALASQAGLSERNKAKLLIVTSSASQNIWQETLHCYPQATALLRVLVVHHKQLSKLLMAPPPARIVPKKSVKARTTLSQGVPTVEWDYIIFDEAHSLKESVDRGLNSAAASVARLTKTYHSGHSPFVLYLTPSPGTSPLDFNLMGKVIGPRLGLPEAAPAQWGKQLQEAGFAVGEGRHGFLWPHQEDIPRGARGDTLREALRRRDMRRFLKALIQEGSPFLARGPQGLEAWPALQLLPLPLTLTPAQKHAYKPLWEDFRTWLNLHSPAREGNGAFQEEWKRFHLRTSFMKNDHLLAFILEAVQTSGEQVYLRLGRPELAEDFTSRLLKKRVAASLLMPGQADTLEEWERFRAGHSRVLIDCLPQVPQEIMGRPLAQEPLLVVHDFLLMAEALEALPLLFTKRDHRLIYYPFIEQTLEEALLEVFLPPGGPEELKRGSERARLLERKVREVAARSPSPTRLS